MSHGARSVRGMLLEHDARDDDRYRRTLEPDELDLDDDETETLARRAALGFRTTTPVLRRPTVDGEPLTDRAADLVLQARSPHTLKAYRLDLADWAGYVRGHRPDLDPVPADPGMLADYLAQLVADGKAMSTIRRRLSAIRYAHHVANLPSPTTHPIVVAATAGAARQVGTMQRRAQPFTMNMLERAVRANGSGIGNPRAARDNLLLILGWAGALRRSELVGLDVGDVVNHEHGVILYIRRSKTDQTGEGRFVVIPSASRLSGRDPGNALTTWLPSVGSGGPLFRPVDRFKVATPVRLTPDAVNVIVKDAVHRQGLDRARYSAHSLRAGFVTEARRRGVPDHLIIRQTGHADMRMLSVYDRPDDGFTSGASALAGATWWGTTT